MEKMFGFDRSSYDNGDPDVKMPGRFKYGLFGRNFDYWLYPDGTHCGYKTFISTKTGFFIGLPLAYFNACFYPAKQITDFLKPFPRRILPLTATGFIFGTAACYSTALRGKDDCWNYLFAGAASGAVFGATINPGTIYGLPILAFAVFAATYKYTKIIGVDWTIKSDKNWTTGDFDGISGMPDHSLGVDHGRLTGYEQWNVPSEKSGQV